MSWTKNLAIAKDFAHNRQPDGETGHVWTATFALSRLLASFAGEQEYLVRAEESDVRRWRT
ncbi:hypothetical protein [Amycolatopsis sp. NPDC051372]|uniref:hypothetical protein n=1 Tax=unclassified Amycolatopsis TaxID=2618356 RepID=UPI00343F693A